MAARFLRRDSRGIGQFSLELHQEIPKCCIGFLWLKYMDEIFVRKTFGPCPSRLPCVVTKLLIYDPSLKFVRRKPDIGAIAMPDFDFYWIRLDYRDFYPSVPHLFGHLLTVPPLSLGNLRSVDQ